MDFIMLSSYTYTYEEHTLFFTTQYLLFSCSALRWFPQTVLLLHLRSIIIIIIFIDSHLYQENI